MGVYEGLGPGMHWQQAQTHPPSVQSCGRIIPTPLYDPARNSSPNLPCAQQEPMNPTLNNNPSCCNFKREYSRSGEREYPRSAEHTNCHDCSSQNSLYASRCNSTTGGDDRKYPGDDRKFSADDRKYPGEERKYSELLEPKQEPPSNLDSDDVNVTCAGCARKIVDRYYLYAVDQRWHVSCLQCSQCGRTLDGEMTCFCKDGAIYCKNDYYRIFGMKRCFRCQATISSTELVMRAQEYVYHVACFSCSTCSNILKKGDHFGMRDGLVYCRSHYQELPMISPDYDDHYTSPSPDFSHHHHHSHHHNHHHHHSIHSSETPSPSNPDSVKVNSFFNGAPTPRQKGRPRKRKPKDIEGLTANLDLNSDSYLDVFPGTPGLGGGNHQRTKRMRTSFKHHQLRTMKSYFAINHNPDAKDLKQLSQKTGLPKRVLQVWFQNARAKWRRLVMKQDGGGSKSGDKSCGENSNSGLDLDSYQLDSPEDSHYLSSPLECSS